MKYSMNEIIHGDCLKIMPQIEEDSFDLILTDPPYNVSQDTKISRSGGKFGEAKDVDLNFGEWDEENILPADYVDEFVRLLKDNGVLCLFYDKLYLGMIGIYLQEKFNYQVRHIGTYIKSNPCPQARKVKWQNGTEQCLIATANEGTGHHFNYELGQSPDYFEHSVNYNHLHPTQKPLDLVKWIVKYWSFKDDKVLDPFLGSGTTAIACDHLNRDWLGIEKEEEYVDIARERLEKEEVESLDDFQ